MIEAVLALLREVPPGEAAILVVATVLFLPAPDIDLLAIRILHHRSILTHSAGWPFLVLWAAAPLGLDPSQGIAAASGAALGVAVHLAADLLSPSRGYGRIWWPEPVQVSLGRWSPLWILGNAIGCAWIAAVLLPEAWRIGAAVVGGAAALGYGIRRERSILSAVVALGVVGSGCAAAEWVTWG